MMSLLISGVLLAASQQDLAYTANFYRPDGKPSFHQVYLVNHDESGLKQITYGNMDHPGVVWLDSNTIAYVEMSNGRVVERPTSETHYYDANIYRYSLKTGKSKRIGSIDNVLSLANCEGKSFTFYADYLPKIVSVTTSAIKVSRKMNTKMDVRVSINPRKPGEPIRLANADFKTPWGAMRIQWTDHVGEKGLQEQRYTYRISGGGHVQTAQLFGGNLIDVRAGKDGAVYISTMQNAIQEENSALHESEGPRTEMFVYRMATAQSVPKLIVSKTGLFHFSPDQPLWFGSQPEYGSASLMPLDSGRRVETRWLVCGNWQTGNRWPVATGLVKVSSHGFRPKK